MITIDTYISILFSIFITSLLGALITIYIQNSFVVKRGKLLVVVFMITIFLIIAATIIFLWNDALLKALHEFTIINIFPFHIYKINKNKDIYYTNVCIFSSLYVVIFILRTVLNIKGKRTKDWFISFIISSSIFFLIFAYLHIWIVFFMTIELAYIVPSWANHIIQFVIFLPLYYIELLAIGKINLFIRKIVVKK